MRSSSRVADSGHGAPGGSSVVVGSSSAASAAGSAEFLSAAQTVVEDDFLDAGVASPHADAMASPNMPAVSTEDGEAAYPDAMSPIHAARFEATPSPSERHQQDQQPPANLPVHRPTNQLPAIGPTRQTTSDGLPPGLTRVPTHSKNQSPGASAPSIATTMATAAAAASSPSSKSRPAAAAPSLPSRTPSNRRRASYDMLDGPISAGFPISSSSPPRAAETATPPHPHSGFGRELSIGRAGGGAAAFNLSGMFPGLERSESLQQQSTVLPREQARTLELQVELAERREHRGHVAIDVEAIVGDGAHTVDSAAAASQLQLPAEMLGRPTRTMSEASAEDAPSRQGLHSSAHSSDSLPHQPPYLTNGTSASGTLDPPSAGSHQRQPSESATMTEQHNTDAPISAPLLSASIILDHPSTSASPHPNGVSTGAPVVGSQIFDPQRSPTLSKTTTPMMKVRDMRRATTTANSRAKSKRNYNPLPPLVPLLPHERVLPALSSIASIPSNGVAGTGVGTGHVRQRSDSFSKNSTASSAAKRMSLIRAGPMRQSTFMPKSPAHLTGGAAADDESLLELQRLPSFDHSDGASLGLLSLDRTEMKRTSAARGSKITPSDQITAGSSIPEMAVVPTAAAAASSSSSSRGRRPSALPRFFSCCTDSAVIPPDSTFLAYWRLLVLVFVLYNMVAIPFRCAFDGLPYATGGQVASYTLDYLGDALFLVDILVSFRTGFTQHGVEVLAPAIIQRRYLTTYAPVDMLASIPLDLIQLHNMELVPYYRLNKLLRCSKLVDLSVALESAPGFHVNVRAKLIKIVFLIFYASHLIACAWFIVARVEGFGYSEWTVPKAIGDDASQAFQYLRSLFWALGLMTGRDYENSTPETDLEALVTFGAMTVGMIGLAYVIGNIAALVEGANEKAKHFQARVTFVARFMASHDVPPQLSDQVARYFEYLWSRNRGFDLPSVLSELPDVLTTDISMYLLQDMVSRVELFAHLDPGFIPALIKVMVANVYLPGEFIVTYGDSGDSMYFLQQGEVDIIKGHSSHSAGEDNDEIILQTLRTGDRFGEYSLILPTQRTASARAVGFCTVYVLYREPFEEIMRVFLKSASVIRQRAKAHHDQTLARERQMLRAAHGAPTGSEMAESTAAAVLASHQPQVEYELDTVRLVLRLKENAREYRKKISVYAFQVDSPVVVNKSWGVSQCEAGDWFVIGGVSDAYTVGNAEFTSNYEAIPAPAPDHMYRKKGSVLAVQVARAFQVQGQKEVLTCKPTDYLVQDETNRQWFVPAQTFEDTYELCVEKANAADGQKKKKTNILDANSAVIKALKGRQESSALTHESIDPRVLLPTSRFWRVWQPIVMAVMLYNALFVPFRISFDIHSSHPAYLVFDYVGDVVLWLDIICHFRLAFIRDGTLVHDLRQIRARYRLRMFYFDVVSTFPLDFFMLYTGMQPLFRLGRVLRVWSLYRISHHYIKASSWAGGLKLGRMLFTFALMAHFESCIYQSFTYFEGWGNDTDHRWLPNEEQYRHSPLAHKYFRAQYYSFVVLTGLGKMIAPETTAEVVFGLLSILLGVVVVSFIIGEIASIVSNLDTFSVEHEKRMRVYADFMRHSHLPPQLQARVRRFLDHQWSVQRGADPNKALNGLPPMLRLQMKMQVAGDAIRRTPFFHRASDATLLAVVSSITFETYPPGEAIFVMGQVGSAMYIINRGVVAIQLPSTTTTPAAGGAPSPLAGVPCVSQPAVTIKTIGKGSFFGEQAVMKNGRRSASAICVKSCDLLVIARKDFLRIVHDDPEFAEQLKKIMQSRLAGVNAHRKKRKAAVAAATMAAAIAGSPAEAPTATTTKRAPATTRQSMFLPNSGVGRTAGALSLLVPSSTGAADGPLNGIQQLSTVDAGGVPSPRRSHARGSSDAGDSPSPRKRTAGSPAVIAPAPTARRSPSLPTAARLHRSFSFATTMRDHREVMALREAVLLGAKKASAANDDDDEDDDEQEAVAEPSSAS